MREGRGPAAEEFAAALAARAGAFGVELGAGAAGRLTEYFEILSAWNARLHLVAPCAPAEFAVRHVLESLLALPYLPQGARFVDVGSGGGLPAIPCLAARADLTGVLVESSAKKAVFLREAVRRVGASERARVLAERFEQTEAPDADAVTCRALERFAETVPRLVGWSPPGATLLFFGGEKIREQLERERLAYEPVRVPLSEQRFLFVIRRS